MCVQYAVVENVQKSLSSPRLLLGESIIESPRRLFSEERDKMLSKRRRRTDVQTDNYVRYNRPRCDGFRVDFLFSTRNRVLRDACLRV